MGKWEMVRLGECFTLSSGKFLPAKKRVEGEYDVFGGNGINGKHNEYFIDNPTVVIGRVGEYCGCVHTTREKVWVTDNALYVTRFLKTIDRDYICYALNQKDLNSYANKSGQPSISQSAIVKIEIPLPPLDTQKQIAKTLDTAAELLAMCRQQFAELENLIKSTFYDMFGDPETNEKGWEMKCVDEIADTRLGKMRDKQFITGNHLRYYLGNSNVKWFSFNFVKMEQMDFDNDEQLKYSLQYGDLLVCEGGEIGRCAIWKCEMKDVYFQKALHRIRVNKDAVNQYYLAYVFYLFSLGNGFEKVTNRATIAHLTGVKLKKILIPTPPVTLQTHFAEIVTKVEEQKALVKKAIDETQYLFDSLMSEYFE